MTKTKSERREMFGSREVSDPQKAHREPLEPEGLRIGLLFEEVEDGPEPEELMEELLLMVLLLMTPLLAELLMMLLILLLLMLLLLLPVTTLMVMLILLLLEKVEE